LFVKELDDKFDTCLALHRMIFVECHLADAYKSNYYMEFDFTDKLDALLDQVSLKSSREFELVLRSNKTMAYHC